MRYLVHLADLHIRAGDVGACRYDEYSHVFCNVVLAIREIASQLQAGNNDLGIVIVGDVFHNKARIDAPGVHLFTQLITGLSKLGHVYLVEGNHDVHQADSEGFSLLDAFTAFFNATPGVTFMRSTGHYMSEDGTCGFGVTSVRDVLDIGDGDALPDFPNPCQFPQSVKHKVALYHGQVVAEGVQQRHWRGSVSDKWFQGYHVCLLGDTHARKVHNSEESGEHVTRDINKSNNNDIFCARGGYAPVDRGDLVWGYSGSLVQQNFGEPMHGHGFMLWDLETKQVTTFDVCNTVAYCSVADADALAQSLRAFEGRLLPVTLHVRSPVDDRVRVQIKDVCTGPDFNIRDVRFCGDFLVPASSSTVREVNNKEVAEEPENACLAFDAPDAWIQYVDTCDHGARKDVVEAHRSMWTKWIKDPSDSLALDPLSVPDEGNCRDKAEARNAKLAAAIKKMEQSVIKPTNNAFSLNYLQWSWLMCYGEDNWVDFADLKSKVSIVSAPNAYGKSSFVDVVGVALFGESATHPGAQLRNIAIATSPDRKPCTRINITMANEEEYEIRRGFLYSATTSAVKTMAELFRIHRDPMQKDSIQGVERVHSGKVPVDTWVKQNLGSASAFAMSCVVGAGTTAAGSFFSLKPTEQMSLLDTHFNMSAVQDLVGILDIARKDTKYVLDIVDSVCRSKCKDVLAGNTMSTIAGQIEKEEEYAAVLRSKLDAATHTHYDTFAHLDVVKDDKSRPKAEHDLSLIPELETIKLDLEDGVDEIRGIVKAMNISKKIDDDDDVDHVDDNKHGCQPMTCGDIDKHLRVVKEMARVTTKFRSYWKEPPPAPIDDASISNLLTHMTPRNAYEAFDESWCVSLRGGEPEEPMGDDAGNDMDVDQKLTKMTDDVHSLQSDLKAVDTSLGLALADKNKVLASMDAEHDRLLAMTNLDDWCEEYRRIKSSGERHEISCGIDQLQAALKEHEDRVTRMVSLRARLASLEDEVSFVNSHTPPFNRECWACRQQGWKVKMDRDVEEAREVARHVEELLAMMGGDAEILVKREELARLMARSKEISRMDDEAATRLALRKRRDVALKKAVDLEEAQRKVEELITMREEILQQLLEAQANIIRVKHLQQHNELDGSINSIVQSEMHKREERQRFDKAVNVMLATMASGVAHKKMVERALKHLHQARSIATFDESYKNLDHLKGKVQQADARVARLHLESAAIEDAEKRMVEYKSCMSMLEDRLSVIVALLEAFSTYRSWVYSRVVLPRMSRHIDATMSMVCASWKVEVNESPDNRGCFVWELVEEDAGRRRVPVSKASGFQKFMLGISAKVAMARMGVTSVACRNLFVDEGFSSCDSDNMGRVPEFLHSLSRWYDNIMITSHLADIKDAAHVCIPIHRDAQGHSKIAWGAKMQPVSSIVGSKRKK